MLIIYLNKWLMRCTITHEHQAEFRKRDNLNGMTVGFITVHPF